VVVANEAGVALSDPAQLTLALPALSFADTFTARGRITTAAGAGTAESGNATLEPGEPRHADKRGGKSLWITWRSPSSGVGRVSTRGSSFDTLLAIYEGASLETLTEIAGDDDSGGFLAGEVQFNVVEGVDYHIAVDGHGGDAGHVVLSWDVTFGLGPLPRLLAAPQGETVPVGGDLTLSVLAEGEGLTYQWFFKRQPIPDGTNAVLNLTDSTPAQAGIYSVRVRNAAGQAIETEFARVEVVTVPTDAPAQDKLEDLFTNPPPGAPVLHAAGPTGFTSVFPGIPGSRDTGNNGAQRSPDDPIILGELGGASIWLRFQALTNGWMQLSTEGSQVPTVLGVYTNRTELHEIALAVPVPPAQHSEVLFGAVRGEDYLVMIDGVDGAGSIKLTYSLELAPATTAKITLTAGTVMIEHPVPPGVYEMAVGDDLTAWAPILTTTVVGGILRFMDTDTTPRERRFYRINELP
jgi:hypothetical protein